MRLSVERYVAEKEVPLAISGSVSAGSVNFIVRVEDEGLVGLGEATEFDIPGWVEAADGIEADLDRLAGRLAGVAASDTGTVDRLIAGAGVGRAARAGVDAALWDWLGRRAGLPVYALWRIDPARMPVTSGTVGLSEPHVAARRARDWLDRFGVRAIKVKLGSEAGPAHDRALLAAVRAEVPEEVAITVDVNCGWTRDTALSMLPWLRDQGVTLVEQPLAADDIEGHRQLSKARILPIFLDESCRTAADIPRLAGAADGINIKLMKCGGPSEALCMIHTARAHGLGLMIGCYGDGILSNSAAAHLAGAVDHVDLDSHLNHRRHRFRGAALEAGRLRPAAGPGWGVAGV